jgi:prolyl-tRNA synthetase
MSCYVAGRWDDIGEELFTLKDRHDKEFVLSPVGKQTKVNYVSNCDCTVNFQPVHTTKNSTPDNQRAA